MDCRGLSNATHKIKAVSLSEAQKTRITCKICYRYGTNENEKMESFRLFDFNNSNLCSNRADNIW